MKDSVEVYKVITANRLSDGAIVYLQVTDKSLSWRDSIHEATVFHESVTERMVRMAEKQEAENIVIAPYAIEITGKHEPLSARETIRAHGPSVKFGRAALEPDFNI